MLYCERRCPTRRSTTGWLASLCGEKSCIERKKSSVGSPKATNRNLALTPTPLPLRREREERIPMPYGEFKGVSCLPLNTVRESSVAHATGRAELGPHI